MTNLENILSNFNSQFTQVQNPQQLEEIRINFLGKKGIVSELFANLKNLDADQKKSFGNQINQLRDQINSSIEDRKNYYLNVELNAKLSTEKLDMTLPARYENQGSIHPINRVIADIEKIFIELNIEFAQGPEN